MKTTFFLLLLFIWAPFAVLSQPMWQPVSYEVSFKIKNAGLTVTGRFEGLKATLAFDPDKLASSSLKASVAVATISTGIGMRDKDLQAEKYFDAEKYKTIEVSSTKLYKKGAGFAGMFHVTIKGTTKQIEIPFDFTGTGHEAEFRGSFPISRKDFGIGGKTLTMSDEADVSIVIKAKS